MTRDYFRTGGPFNAERPDPHHIRLSVPIERDEYGRVARKCPNELCSPGYFTVMYGTGIMGPQDEVYCPYCRTAGDPRAFFTKEQLRYMKEVLFHEVGHAVQRMLKDSCRKGASALTFTPGRVPNVRRPFEDEVQRNVVCPHCGLDHAVYGLATWCPDCGKDIFLTHVEAEYTVIRAMLDDLDRRRENSGIRIAARDLENCLEDVVSIFEAVLKALLTRHQRQKDATEEDILTLLDKKVRNRFQNVNQATEIVACLMGQDLFAGFSVETVSQLTSIFEKRHPVTHNLGVVDRKHIARTLNAGTEGRDVHITKEEILTSIGVSLQVLANLHMRLFGVALQGLEDSE